MSRTQPQLRDVALLTASPLARILEMLNDRGEEARVVGGAVRNTLLGQPVHEIDVATTALPDEVLRRAGQAGIRAVPTGIDHGTVTLVVEGTPYEVTTLREDVETYGRRAKVAFGRDWRRDAERRDFTINALSASPDGVVHDYVGGLADLEARRVRFIGDAAQRIAEDYLRILRFFRFHSAYGEGKPDPAALHACIVARDGLRTLSRERVRMELLKLVVTKGASASIRVMADAGILLSPLGGVSYLSSLDRTIAIEALIGGPPDAIRRLGALTVAIPEDAERLFERLRLSNTEHERLRSMADGWWRLGAETTPQQARALLYRLGALRFVDRALLAFSRASDAVADSRWHELIGLPSRWQPPAFPVSAADLMARGLAPGPALGMALRAAEAAWVNADFPSDTAVVAAIADRAAANLRT